MHLPTLQLALRFRESFAYALVLRAARWAMASVEAGAAAAWRVLLGWRARLRARLSRWRVAGMTPRGASSSEAGEVELQTVQLTAADSAAMDAAPSEASYEGGA